MAAAAKASAVAAADGDVVDVIDLDAEIAAELAEVGLPNVQADGTVWFSVGVGLINVTPGSVVCDRLLGDGLVPIPAPEG